jgi:endonuclease/exonuclease/phosphatase family metal-dependent hydrolase
MAAEGLRVVTWNVHGFVGRDGRRNPERVLAVLDDLGADLVALQEVDARAISRSDPHPLATLADGLRAKAIPGPTLGRPGRDYGNAVLSTLEVVQVRRHDLSRPGVEPRGAVDLTVRCSGGLIRFVAVHLGLRRRERIAQAMRLAELLHRPSPAADLLVVAGDFNSWRRRARESVILERAVGPALAPRTFPSRRPLLRLDRVLINPRAALADWRVVDHAGARAASDHLPICVDLALAHCSRVRDQPNDRTDSPIDPEYPEAAGLEREP